jgi:hypothetical protein
METFLWADVPLYSRKTHRRFQYKKEERFKLRRNTAVFIAMPRQCETMTSL